MLDLFDRLNEEQRSVVYCDDSRILCLAGAGTGKTHCMIARIARLVEDGVDPSSILALTFTNAAGFEMESRYRDLELTKLTPTFKTFHSFCYNLLTDNRLVRLRLGYQDVPAIASEIEEKEVKNLAKIQVGISSSKPNRYEVEVLKKAIDRILRKRNLITFDVLLNGVCKLFEDDESCIRQYKSRYKHIFVDEFQDTDPIQYEFVKSFEDSNIFIVADALQAIYAFRGADSSIVKKLSNDKEYAVIKLSTNYRSTDQICNYANRFSATYADKSYRTPIKGLRPGSQVLEFHISNDYSKMLDKAIEEYQYGDEDIAVIVRTNEEVRKILKYIRSSKTPTRTATNNQLTINLLRSLISEDFKIAWVASLLSTQEYITYIRNLHINKEYSFNTEFLRDFGWNIAVDDAVRRIKSLEAILKSEDTLEDKLKQLCDNLDIDVPNINYELEEENDIIDLLLNTQRLNRTGHGIYVGTIHSVKGLEYDTVYVLGVNGKTFTLSNEENCNLFYVAVTRAKNELYVCYSDDTGGQDEV